MADVVKLNTYYKFDGEGPAVSDFWEQMTRVRLEYLPDPGPAGTAVRVNGFGSEDLLIEVEAIASVGVDRIRLMPKNHWDWSIPTPFSQGWKVGNLVFVGGQVSADDRGRTISPEDIASQTRNVFENIRRVLREAGADMTDVVKLNTYYQFDGEGPEITDFWEQMTKVRLEYLPDPGPAGTAVRVSGFAHPDRLIEVEAIAVIGVEKTRLMPKGHWDWSMPTPFSQGWKAGDLIIVGGQISADAQGHTISPGDIAAQTRNTFENISNVLKEAGADMTNVVKLNTYYKFDGEGPAVTDFWQEMTKVRLEYLPDPGPAGTAVRVSGFAYQDLLIEVEAIASLA
jgi:enamine deaminase RidA (YjgF/YER057c/UK114 family)